MTASYVGNRHARLDCFGQDRQLLVHRPASPALDLRKDFDSINTARHSRITRRTPSASLCSYVRLKWGPLHRTVMERAVRCYSNALGTEAPLTAKAPEELQAENWTHFAQ